MLGWLIFIGVVLFLVRMIAKSNAGKKKTNSVLKGGSSRAAVELSHQSRQAGKISTESVRWFAADVPVSIGGIDISSGLIYVGGTSSSQYGRLDNCVISPGLTVSRTASDRHGATMSYWPSYSTISPEARRAFLDWLAGGRHDPEIGIGHVFLFFYGLERRLFQDKSHSEAPVIVAEVKRLLSIYGANNSFNGYARALLDAASLLEGDVGGPPEASPDLQNRYEIPLVVRLHLGRRLALGQTLDAEDALLWLLSSPNTSLRTPAIRCFEEFREIWRHRFAKLHPGGLKVRKPKQILKAVYRAASGGFQASIAISDGSVPDISSINAPLDRLRELADACSEDLAAFSRLLGRNPASRGSFEALAFLPRDILNSSAVGGIRERLDALLASEAVVTVKTRRLIEELRVTQTPLDKISTGLTNQIGAVLDKFDLGYEPDRRYGPTSLSLDGNVTLFRASDGAPVEHDRAAYLAARTMIEIAAIAAASDGCVSESEVLSIKAEINSMAELSPVERQRLDAHALALLADTPRQQGAIKRLAELPTPERQRIIKSAFSAVLADGQVSPAEVKFLEQLHKALNLPQEDVYAALHRGNVHVDTPVTVALAEAVRGTPIPQQAPKSEGVQIDAVRLARIQKETSAVSSLLAGIFVEEETPRIAIPATVQTTNSPYDGLDAPHAALLLHVLALGEASREDFEAEAKRLKLLPDGAIETINDWGFDSFGEPVLESDDAIIFAEHLRPELQKLEKVS